MTIGLNHFLVLGAALFCLGVAGVLSKRNVIAVLMSVELLFNSVNVTLVAFSRFHAVAGDLLAGQIFAIFIITVAAAELAVAIAILIVLYRRLNTIWLDDFNVLRW
jgi:NADH:ubiquinone oxidoreductase subunit K